MGKNNKGASQNQSNKQADFDAEKTKAPKAAKDEIAQTSQIKNSKKDANKKCQCFSTFLIRTISTIIMGGIVFAVVYFKYLLIPFWVVCCIAMYYEFIKSGVSFVNKNLGSFTLKPLTFTIIGLFIKSYLLVFAYSIKYNVFEMDTEKIKNLCFDNILKGLKFIVEKLDCKFNYSYYETFENIINMITIDIIIFAIVISITRSFKTYVFGIKEFVFPHSLIMLGWAFIGCILFTGVASFNIINIQRGTAVFLVGFIAVIINDIFAYIFGVLFGKKKLIKVSPNKTVAGYNGGAIASIALVPYITLKLFSYEVFVNDENIYNSTKMQKIIFGVIVSAWASIIGPTGGFIASLIKRCAGMKDFSKLIPGHGGVLDRCDCQIMMAPIVYFAAKVVFKH